MVRDIAEVKKCVLKKLKEQVLRQLTQKSMKDLRKIDELVFEKSLRTFSIAA